MSEKNATGRSATTIGSNDRLMRLLYMVIFAIITYALLWLILFLAAVQFLLAWINGDPNDNLRDFAAKLNAYFRDCLDFLGFVTNVVPFPFSPFSSAGDRDGGGDGAERAVKPRSRAKSSAKPSRRTKKPKADPPASSAETDSVEDD